MSPQVSIVIVCMNRPDNLYPCLESIQRFTALSYEVLVVAYLFEKQALARLQASFPAVKFIPSEEIRGFAENNNLALPQAKGEYVLCLNDDTQFTEPLVERLVEDFDKLPSEAAIVSPCIRFPNGEIQTCGRPRQSAWKYILERYHLCSNRNTDDTKGRPAVVDSLYETSDINGACFMIRRSVFEQLGWFDERYFFTPEDIALSTLARARYYKVYVDAAVNITHFHHQTAQAILSATKPAGMRGFMIFYSEGCAVRYFFLSSLVWVAEAMKYLLASLRCLFAPTEKRKIQRQTYAHCLCSLFTCQSPKEIFIKYYGKLQKGQ